MIELRRILLVDWYLFHVEEIDLAGMTALIGPNGAGKSAIIDAVQTVLTGANMHSIRFNPSAQNVARSKRSIRDYCLGVVSLDEKGENSEPTRSRAYTYVVLGFVDMASGDAVSLGLAFSASAERSEESCEARFLVRGGLVAKADLLEPVGDDEVETRHWHAVRTILRARGWEVDDAFGSAAQFVEEVLRALSPPGYPLDPRRFIKAFRNALLLRPVENPTEFVRNYVLDVPPIHVDRLRRSIELYRFLTARIEELKRQTASLGNIHRVVARIGDNERAIRWIEWQVARVHWEVFRRERRRLVKELNGLRKDALTKASEATLAASRLARIEADFMAAELRLKSSDAEQLASMYDADRNRAIAERLNAVAPIRLIEDLVHAIETLTERRIVAGLDDVLHGLLSAVVLAHKPVAVTAWREEIPDGWENPAVELDAALASVTAERLFAVRQQAEDSTVRAQMEVRELQDRIAQIDANLKRIDEGRSPIEPGTAALLRALDHAGIDAEPLCDIVEVRDQKWRLAVEAALGRSREALIVAPERAIEALDIYRRGSEESYRHAEVVNTTKTPQTRPADKGSLATVVATDNRHARAFLDYRIGRLMMVETTERLLAFENAITPDRMMQSGRTVKRLSHPGHLKLGHSTAEETRRLLQVERTETLARLAEKARTAERLRDDGRLIDDVVRAFEQMRNQGLTCVELGRTLAAFDRRITELTATVDEARRNRDPELVAQLERLQANRKEAARDKENAERASRDAHGAENRVAGNLEKLVAESAERLANDRRARARQLKGDDRCGSDTVLFEGELRQMATDMLASEIGTREEELKRRSDRRQSLTRELNTVLLKHCQDFSVSVPFSVQEAEADVVGHWALAEKQRLETHELVQYEEQCRIATGEMTAAFRDDLLHRLHDAFENIRETLAELNRHLQDRMFHNGDYYVFRHNPEPAHADLIELVRESRRPDFDLPLFASNEGADNESGVMRAVRQIETILDNPEAKTEEIEDPRRYFRFELLIRDENGRIRSSLTSRAGTGSGGEGQLPFYIAIGASLAATYQNRRTGQSGLALAIFDEAFNRLDSKAVCACSEFMTDLGLQVVVATPDEKRHIFMEVADTIVNVNRSGNQVLVDCEYLTEKTRKALSDIDPYRKGFDAFKAELIAATADTSEQVAEGREAAE